MLLRSGRMPVCSCLLSPPHQSAGWQAGIPYLQSSLCILRKDSCFTAWVGYYLRFLCSALRHMDLPGQHWFRLKSSMRPTQTCSGLSVQDPALSVSYHFLLLVPASMLLHSQSPMKYCWIQMLRDSTPFLWHQLPWYNESHCLYRILK